MKNVFSTKKVSSNIRMYASKDERQRFYGKDKDYFISYNIRIQKDAYTIAKAYSYAVLDMYGETLHAGFCGSSVKEIDTSDIRARYITISGLVSSLGAIMVLDAPKSETGDNPSYIPCDEDEGGGGGSSESKITSFLANDFNYDENSNSYVITNQSPKVSSYNRLGDEFTVYVNEADSIQANSSLNLFDNLFKIYHINGEPLDTTIESVASVMPFLCSKETKTARMLYSYVSTSQTGLGLEDLFLDVEDEPFSNN